MAVGREREAQLRDSWNAETEDTASATWREGLTREEARSTAGCCGYVRTFWQRRDTASVSPLRTAEGRRGHE